MKKLTIGMAVYDDAPGVWFTIQDIRDDYPELMDQIEFIVVDNNPESKHGKATKDWVERWVSNGRYIPFEKGGTAAPRNHIFEVATAPSVLCLDSHVLLGDNALPRLLSWYEQFPDALDLFHGPMIYDGLDGNMATHMNEEWRDGMFGTWGFDPRGSNPDFLPFDIRMHGLGLFSCRKDAWLGFNPKFERFGGEEGYIHEKYRTHGRKTMCLPFLRWNHCFLRPEGPKYPICNSYKLRNYLIGWKELGMNLNDPINHFRSIGMHDAEIKRIIESTGIKHELPPKEQAA
ncbi:glycosyltransferase [Gimesia fumaroli]|uniref:Glycosyl transferase family 2 n=1 Tax=Gimesia fumaroli TaxID=2527976 RepID=A0A518I8T9_9PLAN|nr:glycosyltransferase [Gimesia fumaroli]QDV49526.1 Glycosyl transferase family 2 [Gimesia fumaroli]